MRAACPRAGGRPDWPAPVVGSPRKPCRARCARLARARADRAAAAPTPGPSLMAADRPGGMRAGAPSCGKAGDACRDLQRDEGFDGAGASLHGAPWPSQSDKCAKGRKRLCHAAFRDAGQRGATTVPRRRTDRFRHCNAMRKCRGGAGMALASAGAHWPALCRALGAWCPGRSVRCTVETGLTSVMHASNRRASLNPTERCAATQKQVRPGSRQGRRHRGWPGAPEGLAGLDGVAAGAAEGMADDAVPEIGLGPGWLRSQPAQPSTATIASTAAGRARGLQVTVASLRRRAGNGCAGRYAWSYCSR